MADDTRGGPVEGARPTSEERLRAIASDRRRKARKGDLAAPVDPTRRPGDTVDAVRERSRDTGRDQP